MKSCIITIPWYHFFPVMKDGLHFTDLPNTSKDDWIDTEEQKDELKLPVLCC